MALSVLLEAPSPKSFNLWYFSRNVIGKKPLKSSAKIFKKTDSFSLLVFLDLVTSPEID